MDEFAAFILGLIQGLTEFLPVSSSGHIELGKALLGVEIKEDITFTVLVHAATVLSTITVFYKEIWDLIRETLKFKWNEATGYVSKIFISMIPVGIAGLFFKDKLEALFNGQILLVGAMLLVTGLLLLVTNYAKRTDQQITFGKAFVIGISQAIAVLPGISRSGATISTALLLNARKEAAAKFSFLMVLIPIIGATAKDALDGNFAASSTGPMPLVIGFVTAFITGVIACKWMLSIVKKGKLTYFAIYCFLAGGIAILSVLLF